MCNKCDRRLKTAGLSTLTVVIIWTLFHWLQLVRSISHVSSVVPTSQERLFTNMSAKINTTSHLQRLPNCLLIGVRKGGTRALIEMMGLHSQIQIAQEEIHFFDNDENYKKVQVDHCYDPDK